MELIQVEDLEEYQRLAEATMNPGLDRRSRLANTVMGLCDESFELFELFHYRRSSDDNSPVVYDSPPYSGAVSARIVEELGDVMWYAAVLVDSLGGKLSEVCRDLFSVVPWNEFECPLDIMWYAAVIVNSPPGPLDASRLGEVFYTAWVDICLNASKITGMLKKHLYQGHDMTEDMLQAIYGHVAKIVAGVRIMAGLNESSVSEVCCSNITKLRQRYPDGKFSAEASVNRTV